MSRNAALDSPCCRTCGRGIRPSEPIWLHLTAGRTRSFCDSCGPRYAKDLVSWLWSAFACQGCGRTVHRFNRSFNRSFSFSVCSPRCRAIAFAAARKEARHVLMQHTCAVCGQPFEGRRDARVCSSACRQRAYRRGKVGRST
jgi:hypothetical protein